MFKKNILTSLFVVCLVATIFSFSLQGFASQDSVNTLPLLEKDQFIKGKNFESFKKAIAPYLNLIKEKQSQYPNTLQLSTTGQVQPYGPAPALYYLEVYAAISTNYPYYEYFDDYQFSSVQNHGGAELYIVTAELGYGYSRVAKMNGRILTSIDSEPIDLEGDSIVDGWFYWWDASGDESGTFTYQNTSTNYPWNTMSDSIYIK